MQIDSVETNSGKATSAALSSTACWTFLPRPIWRLVFSISTSALSTRMPMASARPPRVIRLKVAPASARPMTEQSRARGIEVRTISVERQEPRKSSTTNATRQPTSRISWRTPLTAARTKTDWSKIGSTLSPGGAAARMSGRRARMPSMMSMVEALPSLRIEIMTALWPSSRAMLVGSASPSRTLATSRRRMVFPSTERSGRSRKPLMLSGLAFSSMGSSRPPSRIVPAGRVRFWRPTAVLTSAAVRPNASSACGSRSIMTCRAAPP